MKNKRLIAFVGFLILLITILGLFDAINNKIYENYIIFNKEINVSPDIVIIEVDSKSIKGLGRWPWKRSIYAKLLEKIKTYPKAIGLMISFNESYDKSDDTIFLEALKSIPIVTLIPEYKPFEVSDTLSLMTPEINFFKGLKQGHSLLNYSKSGVVKSIPPFKMLPAFSLVVSKDYYIGIPKLIPVGLKNYFKNIADKSYTYSTNEEILIDYRRTPDQFKRFSFVDVLENRVNLEELRNKIVLIGVTDKYKTGGYVTPFTGERTKTKSSTDVELQAQIIDSFISFRNLREIPSSIVIVISLLLAFSFFLIINNKRVLYQGITLTIFIIVLCIIDFIIFKYFAIWLPPAFPIILILLIYSLSEYLSTTKVDNLLMEAINNIQKSNSIPLKDIPSNIDSRAEVLSNLLEIINNDRHAIKKIIDSINSGIIVLNDTGKIIWVNEKFYKLLNREHILYMQIEELIEALNIDIIKEEINEQAEFKTYLKINNLDIACVTNAIPGNDQYVAIFNDITELRQASLFKNEMVKIVSHEMRSPLTSIILCAENIFSMNESKDSTDHATRIIKTSRSMLDTINNFLSINKLEYNILQVNKEPTDILSIINKSIEMQMPIARYKNIDIKVISNVNDPLNIDPKLILMAMNVLISNAINYSSKDSEIIITIEKDKNFLISVKDEGAGIPKSELDMIFEKFYRASNIKKENIEGTGLGLAIAKKIIDLHNGKISVESEVNKGSIFTLTLPTE